MDLPKTAAGYDKVQVHVDFLSGKVHAATMRSAAEGRGLGCPLADEGRDHGGIQLGQDHQTAFWMLWYMARSARAPSFSRPKTVQRPSEIAAAVVQGIREIIFGPRGGPIGEFVD